SSPPETSPPATNFYLKTVFSRHPVAPPRRQVTLPQPGYQPRPLKPATAPQLGRDDLLGELDLRLTHPLPRSPLHQPGELTGRIRLITQSFFVHAGFQGATLIPSLITTPSQPRGQHHRLPQTPRLIDRRAAVSDDHIRIHILGERRLMARGVTRMRCQHHLELLLIQQAGHLIAVPPRRRASTRRIRITVTPPLRSATMGRRIQHLDPAIP